MKVGLNLHPERGIDEVIEEACQADTQGFHSVWLDDHLMSGHGPWRGDSADGPFDTFTLMTAIGAVTTDVHLAWGILNISFRYPAMLAKVLATLDHITKGRVIASVGSGSAPDEYEAYHIPLLRDHDERVGYTREVVELLKELWTHPAPARTTYRGKHVTVTDLPFAPAPYQRPHPQIWLGGESDPTIQIVKDLADGWVMLSRPGEVGQEVDGGGGARDVSERMSEVLAAPDWPTDRPMAVVVFARLFVDETHDAAVSQASRSLGIPASDLEKPRRRVVIGTPEECVSQINSLANAGVNYLRVTFDDLAQQERVSRLLLRSFPEIFA